MVAITNLRARTPSPDISDHEQGNESEDEMEGGFEFDEGEFTEAKDGEMDVDEAEETEDDEDIEEEESTSIQNYVATKGKRKAKEEEEEPELTEEQEDILRIKRDLYFEQPVEEVTSLGTFAQMQISRPYLLALTNNNISTPTKIQTLVIPHALKGKDICASAQTGSGKTIAFLLPTLERLLHKPKHLLATRVAIVLPTRELASQCATVCKSLISHTDITFALCIGGSGMKEQEMLLRKSPDIVIATPGRLIDVTRNLPGFSLDSVEILILDEADRMLSEGFKLELNEIIKMTPKQRQTLLFSATMTDDIENLTRLSLNRPVRLYIENNKTAENLTQEFVKVKREEDRTPITLALCTRTFKRKTIVFVQTKKGAHQMHILFELEGIKAVELHGDLNQAQRLASLEAFKTHKATHLICTDVAARGLDIPGVEVVINHSLPLDFTQYVHRVGRTARASASGKSISLVAEGDRILLKQVLKTSNSVKQRIIPADVLSSFRTIVTKRLPEIEARLEDDQAEKELDDADKQVDRAENRLLHQDEILSRPQKTWFLSEAAKANDKKNQIIKHAKASGHEPKRIPRSKKRKLEAMKEDPDMNKKVHAQKGAKRALKKAGGEPIKKKSKDKKKGKPMYKHKNRK